MKKTITFLSLIIFSVYAVFATPVDPEKALETANSFWKGLSNVKKAVLHLSVNDGPSKSASKGGTSGADAQYYLFAPENGEGFVIVSGEDRLSPIVGYSVNNSIGEMPQALVDFLDQYSNYVDDVRAAVIEPVKTTATTGEKIEPMLKTSWNQSAPYNNYCPEANGQRTPTGCTATAMAQIMKFHEWPKKAKKNIVWTNNITGIKETVSLTSHTYQWSKMLDHYRDGYTAEQADAVAQLMVDVGKAINSSYSLSGTGSSDIYASYALVNIFDYSPDVSIIRRSEYTEDEYIAIIRENLEARQPLLYTGISQSYGSGHAFVCDGIDENNMLHIDWGWDGAYNGYFDMTYMSPSGIGIGGGDGRYNVGQALIANIRPRESGESNADGVPTVYIMDVVDVNADIANNEVPKTMLEQSADFVNGTANVRIVAGFLNWSHSSIDLSMIVGFEKDGEIVSAMKVTDAMTMSFQDDMGYYITLPVSNNPSDENYLEKGTYTISMYYGDIDDNSYYVRGAENGLRLDVEEKQIQISKILPEVEVTEVAFHATPSLKGDRIALDAKFRSNNGRSATLLITPVLNKVQQDGTYTSTVLGAGAALIQVYDDREIFATFDTGSMIPSNGEYFISFKYNLRNEFIDLDKTIDKATLVDVIGKSSNFIVADLSAGAVPSMTVATVNKSNIVNNEKLSVSVTVRNISSTNDVYSGTLAVFVENTTTSDKFALTTENVSSLAKDEETTISYNSNDYFPIIPPGRYSVYVCERKNGKWEKIRQSSSACYFSIQANSIPMPYANARYDINGGEKVRQGSDFDIKMELICMDADFNGYIQVSTKSGLVSCIISENIPVSLKKGVVSEIVVPCSCKANTALKQYRLNVNCYDSSKNKLGILSHNTITYPGNGYFWVADATAIDDVSEGESVVTVSRGSINVCDTDAVVTVYTLDGRTVYCGAAATVPVEKGLYVVTVTAPGKSVETRKVLVK